MPEKPCGVALSLRGHDAGELFLAFAETEKTVLLADGKRRKLESPKRKNLRHVRFLPEREFAKIRDRLDDTLNDAQLRRILAVIRNGKPFASTEQGGT
jgi:ribosomal protein L14E/L6E/L27E